MAPQQLLAYCNFFHIVSRHTPIWELSPLLTAHFIQDYISWGADKYIDCEYDQVINTKSVGNSSWIVEPHDNVQPIQININTSCK